MFLFVFCLAVPKVRADAAVLLGEPYGGLGTFIPTGHVAVYLNRVCAASPVELRPCAPGESGVVISRYHNVAGYDWIAVPLIPYLYAVERAAEVPTFADRATVALLRDSYRRRYLRELIPDGPEGRRPPGEWYELVGAAYDRRLFAFNVETTEVQDEALIREFNSRKNKRHFNLLFRNCADFARAVINFYYPKAIRRSIIADLGITTPKQVAKSMVRYGQKHPELHFSAFVIPQVPGSRTPSKRVRGVLEALVKSKKYAVPLTALRLWATPALAAGYFTTGRFDPAQFAITVRDPVELEEGTFLASGSPLDGEGSGQIAGPPGTRSSGRLARFGPDNLTVVHHDRKPSEDR